MPWQTTCDNRSKALTYPAPGYFPCPPFVVSLETQSGACDLGSPPLEFSTQRPYTKAERQQGCTNFSRGVGQFPEPFVAQVITSFLGKCLSSQRRCHAIDLGGNLGIHTAYMASLGAEVDVVEPQADLVESIRRTVMANCWEGRVHINHGGATADEASDGKSITFKGGWRLDDKSLQRKRVQSMRLFAMQRLLRGRTIDLLKIDIDNSQIEEQLIVELERLIAARATTVQAVVIEVSTSRVRSGKARALARALSRLQREHGYSAYRLAHHLHSMDELEPWYTPCIAVRTIKYMLHIKAALSPKEWTRLLRFSRDEEIATRWRLRSGFPRDTREWKLIGRTDTASLLLSHEPVGLGSEARWNSADSMDLTMPALWRDAHCGMPGAETRRSVRSSRQWPTVVEDTVVEQPAAGIEQPKVVDGGHPSAGSVLVVGAVLWFVLWRKRVLG